MDASARRPSSYGAGDRRMEIVSGNQIYSTRPRSPDPSPVRPRAKRGYSAEASKPWGFTDPKMKRKKRIAKYKVYTVEGKVKASLRNGLRRIKNKSSQIIHGY